MSYEFRVKIAFQKKKMIGILGHIVFVVLPYNNQSAEGAGGLGIIMSNKVGETE